MIPYYEKFISKSILNRLHKEAKSINGITDLLVVGDTPAELQSFENADALQFVCNLYDKVSDNLNHVLKQRDEDWKFIKEQSAILVAKNKEDGKEYLDEDYQTVIGLKDKNGRIVVGPYFEGSYYDKVHKSNWQVAPIPEHLTGFHITLFGPADTEKMSINAMNAWHRKPQDEPEFITKLVENSTIVPRWGADDEDSKTPTKLPFLRSIKNLTGCFNRTIHFVENNGREYKLQDHHLSHPIKRFPGLALPNANYLYKGNPLPFHLYDFALHLFHHWNQPEALCFYVPKLENEEEARYLKQMIQEAEEMLLQKHRDYKLGTVRLLIVLENPRAIFRLQEIMYELHPYFAGASLGWHDYLASTACLFQREPEYRIPVKADPDIVINHIKESHELLKNVLGARKGIKIGGMYGTLPESGNERSYQLAMIGFIRDVITQLKRGLDGFWIAHPDFLRPGIAIIEAWNLYEKDPQIIKNIVCHLVSDKEEQQEVMNFIEGDDVSGLNSNDPLYKRALLAADIEESKVIANNDPEEVRYNVFQALQYLVDWLSGNGCVALPAQIKGIFVRIMDDLATTERSRREVWAEVHHGRFSKENLRKVFAEEIDFIRNSNDSGTKKIQVKWDDTTAKWYPIAEKILYQLMTEENPVEFVTEYLLPFTLESIRNSDNPWQTIQEWDSEKYGAM